jgi:hypothetical protein
LVICWAIHLARSAAPIKGRVNGQSKKYEKTPQMLASDLLRFPALDGPGLFLRSSLRFEQLTYPVRLGWRCAMFGLFLALETLQLFQVQGCEKVLYRNSIGSFFRKAVGLR